ncbi:T9SS type A sorting domain-containing protein [Flammeovirga agarivorans]|uniref:T9SS type A sorting domain-containing protein n=1 Tax=Flammeovirga agarivorans TaxID=2726742 RepID=A0A7X8SMW9_9BACT|nr:T9SS type A sorting domain-containing protein [Flammeovirga agarivorans]NLR93163.1 T9SS type A sorting domain-containing protein [Flammeovirga agarivorans]
MKYKLYYYTFLLLFCTLFSTSIIKAQDCSETLSGNVNSNITQTDYCYKSGGNESLIANGTDITWTVGDGTNEATVNIDYTSLQLTGDSIEVNSQYVPQHGVHLIVESNATVIIEGDLILNNLSKITVKNGGLLYVKGNLFTQHDTFEETSGITLTVNTGGTLTVVGNATLYYILGYIDGNFNVLGTSSSEQIDQVGVNQLSGWRTIVFWANILVFGGALNDYLAYLDDLIADLELAIDNNVNIDDDITNISNDPFSANLVINNFPSVANNAKFFDDGFSTESLRIFTDADLENITLDDPLSLADKQISITGHVDIEGSHLSGHQEAINVTSLDGFKYVLKNIVWSLPSNVQSALIAYKNDEADETEKETLYNYFTADPQVTITITDVGSGSRMMSNARVLNDGGDVTINVGIPGDLPVELISFTAEAVNDDVEINWETASEFNADYFLVQKSIDNKNWETIHKVSAQGTTNVSTSYEYTDIAVAESAYYRLHQFDFDGRSEIFGPIKVNAVSNILADFLVYPNHNQKGEKVNFEFSRQISLDEYYVLNILNIKGELIMSKEFNKQIGSITLPEDINTGMYLLQFNFGRDKVIKKIVVQ